MYLKQVTNYVVNCLPEYATKTANILVYTTRAQTKQLCNKPSKRLSNLLEAAQCANDAITGFQSCNLRFIDALLGAETVKSHKLRLPIACCNFHEMKKCFWDKGQDYAKCNDQKLANIDKFVEALTGNLLGVVCSDYDEDSDKCAKVVDELTPKRPKGVRRPKSFFLPLIRLLALGDN